MAPGVYYDIPEGAYHADPALSSSGARKLLSCPAKFQWEREHGTTATRAMEAGTAAHLAVLGVGPDLVVVDTDNWRSKAARATRDEARADGAVPLLASEYDEVQAMAEVIRQHPVAGPLFAPGDGRAEVSIWWTCPDTGVSCRARLDWLRNPQPGRRLIIPDYKTTADASPAAIAKSIATYGYHQQADWYTEAVEAAGLAPQGALFVLVFQEKSAPYVVTPVILAPSDLMYAAVKNAAARAKFAECSASGHWPDYADGDFLTISQPAWAQTRDEAWL